MTGRGGRWWWVLNGGGSGGTSAIGFLRECIDLWWKIDVLVVVVCLWPCLIWCSA